MYAIACKADAFWNIISEFAKQEEYVRICDPEQLRSDNLARHGVKTIFFPHWSWIVPNEIIEQFDCVCFHSAPVPFGRGGSPVQNMIQLGMTETEVVALKMNGQLDSGPVYMRKKCSLIGGGEEVYIRIYNIIAGMIGSMCNVLPEPQPQSGAVTLFKRRKPHESEIPLEASIEKLFDHIRMLDVENYPKAYLNVGNLKLTFSRPALRFSNKIEANVTIEYFDDRNRPL